MKTFWPNYRLSIVIGLTLLFSFFSRFEVKPTRYRAPPIYRELGSFVSGFGGVGSDWAQGTNMGACA